MSYFIWSQICIFLTIGLQFFATGSSEDLDFPQAFQTWDFRCKNGMGIHGLSFWVHKVGISVRDPMVQVSCAGLSSVGTSPFRSENCYDAKAFILNLTKIEFKDEYNCKRGEYVAGIKGSYARGIRTVNMHCCQAGNAKLDRSIGCNTVGPVRPFDFDFGSSRLVVAKNPIHPDSRCPRDALTDIDWNSDGITLKFCPLAVAGGIYKSDCSKRKEKFLSPSSGLEFDAPTPVSLPSSSSRIQARRPPPLRPIVLDRYNFPTSRLEKPPLTNFKLDAPAEVQPANLDATITEYSLEPVVDECLCICNKVCNSSLGHRDLPISSAKQNLNQATDVFSSAVDQQEQERKRSRASRRLQRLNSVRGRRKRIKRQVERRVAVPPSRRNIPLRSPTSSAGIITSKVKQMRYQGQDSYLVIPSQNIRVCNPDECKCECSSTS